MYIVVVVISRIATKTTFDSLTGTLLALGGAGLSLAIYNSNVMAGLFGVIAIFLGILISILRNNWNEKSKEEMQKEMEEEVIKRITTRDL